MNDSPPDAKAVFLAAIELESPEQVDRYLDEACGDDRELRGRVERLLRAHEDAGRFLGGDSSDDTADLPITEKPGTVIGPYKLLKRLGSGGFGVVYLAEQTEPVKRRLDGDGNLDVVAGLIWLNDGLGHFSSTGQRIDKYDDGKVAIGDVDADGDLNAVVVNAGYQDAPNEVWLNDGQGYFGEGCALRRLWR